MGDVQVPPGEKEAGAVSTMKARPGQRCGRKPESPSAANRVAVLAEGAP